MPPEQDTVARGVKSHEDLLISLFKKVGVPVHPDEIERVHPTGHYKSKNRQFIVRFVNYKSHQKSLQIGRNSKSKELWSQKITHRK